MSGMDPKDKPSIVAVLTHYGFEFPAFMRPGGTKVKCAFHGDRVESAVVNQDTQSVTCFACGRKGDSIRVIQDEEGFDFKEAMEFAAEQGWTSGPVEAFQPSRRKGRKKRNVRSVRRRRRE